MSDTILLLKAVNHNWGMTGPGDWESTEWFVFSDRSYRAVLSYRPDLSDDGELTEKTIKEFKGSFSKAEFSLICKILDGKWIDPAINSEACDGEAWQIKMLFPSGRTKKSSGKLGYIYHQPIEQLVHILDKHIMTLAN